MGEDLAYLPWGTFRDAKRDLLKAFPLPVTIRLMRFKKRWENGCSWDMAGECSVVPGGFLIEIDRRLDETSRVLVLLHEFAHVMATRGPDHGRSWSRAYSKIYSKFVA